MAAFDPLKTPINVVMIGRGGKFPIAPKPTPGVAEVRDADMKIIWLAQQGAGTTGAPLLWRGSELIKFFILIKLFTSQHWLDWEDFRTLVQAPPSRIWPAALTVSHPWLTMQGVSAAQVELVSQPNMSEDMLGTIKIGMIQYRQSHVTYATVKKDPPKPLSPIQQLLKERTATLASQNAAVAPPK